MYLDPATFAVVALCHWDAGVQAQNGEVEQQKALEAGWQEIGNSSTATARDISNLVRC